MKKKLILICAFAVAMGYLEAAVVVYLRQLCYPEGFAFPMKQIPQHLALIEVFREAATIVMMLTLAFIFEKTPRARLIAFMLIFGIWDISYYAWLRATIDWPGSLLTWDILFLIPLIWTGPVIAPILVSIAMVTSSAIYYSKQNRYEFVWISKLEWALVILGAALIFVSFITNHDLAMAGRVPTSFLWEIFIPGLACASLAVARVLMRASRLP
ncbi:MAG: hypothetical protein ACUVQ7_09265 [bacterium]